MNMQEHNHPIRSQLNEPFTRSNKSPAEEYVEIISEIKELETAISYLQIGQESEIHLALLSARLNLCFARISETSSMGFYGKVNRSLLDSLVILEQALSKFQ